MKLYRFLLKIVVVAGLVYSCSSNSVYDGHHSFDKHCWNVTDTVTFTVDLTDTTSAFNTYIAIRNTPKYQSMNLWLYVNCKSPSGHVYKDTINCFLSDKRGHWLGSGLGDTYATRHLLKENVLFNEIGSYEFTFIQGMRTEDLKGVSDIGINIEKLENK